MDPDSRDDSSDLDATYQAFDRSGSVGAHPPTFATPPSTGEQTLPAPERGPEENTAPATGRFEEEESIPVDAEGHLFGKYRVLNKLGGGGMGFVWLVEHVAFEQRRALKIIKSGVADNPVNLDRFRREARILAKLSGHPNAVLVYDTNIVGKFAYIEMDYLEGQTLRQRLDRVGPMPMADVAWFLGELCSVLGDAHALGVVHRDIKPQNIMIVPAANAARGERVKVLDFGIAKIIKDASGNAATLTLHTEGFLGTYPYSSPEQLGLPLPGQKEAAAIDARSDIYSAGVLLYEMVSGVRPFTGHLTRILYDQAHTPPPAFAEVAPGVDVPAGVEAVIRRCLEKDPARRPQSVRELLEEFRAAAAVTGPIEEAPTYVLATETWPRPPAPPVLPASRSISGLWRRNGAIVGALVLFSAAGLAFLFVPRRDRAKVQPPPPPVVAAVAPRIAEWLGSNGLEPISAEGLDDRGWPRVVRRKSGEPPGNLGLNGRHYLPADFSAETASGTGAGGLPKALECRKNPVRFILIEGGSFTMGAFDDKFPFDQETEQPGHRVTLSAFYMQETEVSIGDFARFCKDTGLDHQSPEVRGFFEAWDKLADVKGVQDRAKLRDNPATGVTHRMASAYARWMGGDLPTEAQWEFAARSGGKPRIHVWDEEQRGGEQISALAHVANWDASWPCEVGFRGNADRTEQGIYHMAGNVREWCRDAWRTYRGDPQQDPVGKPEEGEAHPRFAIRGGSYATPTETARVTWRADCLNRAYRRADGEDDEDLGFRVVLPVLACPPDAAATSAVSAWLEDRP